MIRGRICRSRGYFLATSSSCNETTLSSLACDAVKSMTSANSLSLILRCLDEVEGKLDRMLQELGTPAAIGYSVRRGNLPRKDN